MLLDECTLVGDYLYKVKKGHCREPSPKTNVFLQCTLHLVLYLTFDLLLTSSHHILYLHSFPRLEYLPRLEKPRLSSRNIIFFSSRDTILSPRVATIPPRVATIQLTTLVIESRYHSIKSYDIFHRESPPCHRTKNYFSFSQKIPFAKDTFFAKSK